MEMTEKRKAEALTVARDAAESKRIRAIALTVAVGSAATQPELYENLRKLELASDVLKELRRDLVALLKKRNGVWVVGAEDLRSYDDRLKERRKTANHVWIIHGGSSQLWKDIESHFRRQFYVSCMEFDDPHVEKVEVGKRVMHMLKAATFAVAVMSSEDELPGGTRRARQNVIHEIGLAQGRLGIERVIIMLEEGVEPFSNMSGILYTPFKTSQLQAAVLALGQELENRIGLFEGYTVDGPDDAIRSA